MNYEWNHLCHKTNIMVYMPTFCNMVISLHRYSHMKHYSGIANMDEFLCLVGYCWCGVDNS